MPTANFDGKAKEAWLKQNTIDKPTYRSGAQKVVDPGLIYEDSTKALEQMGGQRPTSWNEIRYSPVITRAIRALLRGEKLALGSGRGIYDRNYSRKQFMLPVFTMAIFHAEPARNERAWPINLMLLDLAETGTANFTWDAILWHPEAINPINLDPYGRVQARVVGPKGKGPKERDLVEITDRSKLHLVGGILPASPTGGGERGKPSLYRAPKSPKLQARARGVVEGPGNFIKIPFDFIHQKEIDVLLKWLLRFSEVKKSWSLCGDDTVPEDQLISAQNVLAAQHSDQNQTISLKYIEHKIKKRIESFDVMF